MAMSSGKGLKVSLQDSRGLPHALLFGEDQARYVLAVPADLANFLQANAEGAGVPFRSLGTVGGDAVIIDDLVNLSVTDLGKAHEGWFPAFMN